MSQHQLCGQVSAGFETEACYLLLSHKIKGSLTRFINQCPRAPEYPIRTISNFFENSRRYSRMNVYRRCQRHQRKKGENFFGYFWPVSTTPGKIFWLFCYFWPVSTTLYWWQRSALAAKLSPAANIVSGTAMKTRKGTSQTLIRGPGGRQSCFKPKLHYLVLAASGASDQDVCGVFGCNFSWRFQWHHRRPWPTSAAGDIADLSPSTFSYPWQLPTSMASLFLWPTKNLSPVSLSPAIIVHRCRCHRQ